LPLKSHDPASRLSVVIFSYVTNACRLVKQDVSIKEINNAKTNHHPSI